MQFFQPCMCKGKWSKFIKPFGLNRFTNDKWSSLASPHQTSASDISDLDIQRMMSTETISNDLRAPPEGKQAPEQDGFGVFDDSPEPSLPHSGCPDDFRLVNEAHMLSGDKVAGSLMECQYSCLSKPDCLGVDWNRFVIVFLDLFK